MASPEHTPGSGNAPRGAPAPITVAMREADAVFALERAAKRGRLAGFMRGTPGSGRAFSADAYGTPFEGELVAFAQPAGEAGTTFRFERRMRTRLPWVFAIVLVLTVWPGVVLTKSMLAAMIPGWTWLWETTWWWYMPLSIVGAVWGMWSALRKSRVSIDASAHETAAKVGQILTQASATAKA